MDEIKEIIAEGFGVKNPSKILSEKVNDAEKLVSDKGTEKRPKNPQNEDVWAFDQI